MRQPAPCVGQLVSQRDRITVIQFFGFVQFHVTAPRRVRHDPLYGCHPRSLGQGFGQMVGMSAVDHEIRAIPVGLCVHLCDSLLQCATRRQTAIGLDSERNPHRQTRMPYRPNNTNRLGRIGQSVATDDVNFCLGQCPYMLGMIRVCARTIRSTASRFNCISLSGAYPISAPRSRFAAQVGISNRAPVPAPGSDQSCSANTR